MNPRYVLDTFAILAWMGNEPGAEAVQAVLDRASKGAAGIAVSWVNLAEVYYIARRYAGGRDGEAAAIRAIQTVEALPVEIAVADKAASMAAARIKAAYPLSLADAFAASLAASNQAQLLTGDPEFKRLEQAHEIEVRWLPQKPKKSA